MMPSLPVPRRRMAPPATPEALYDTLQGTDAGVRHLWAHQADALRTYYDRHRDSSDVALEFPTGAGKTLVGALIGEWRRQTMRERVAFVCPTNQLAHQAAAKAASYGIKSALLIGPHREWDASDVSAFNSGSVIAVTNYHHIFNSNPKLEAQALVLDDAHAGEPAVANRWSVDIRRSSPCFHPVREAISDSLPSQFARMLREDDADPVVRKVVELVGPPDVMAKEEEITRAIERSLDPTTPEAFGWRTVQLGLSSCLIYVSWSGISIRPLIAPTSTLDSFAGAGQRIYMSATLGQAGELERSFGVDRIDRIPLPRGWERQGSGRRLPLFPGLVDSDPAAVIRAAALKAKHSLVITPSDIEATYASQSFVPLKAAVLTKEDVSVDFSAFTDPDVAILILANRYDGMDLPDDSCRLVVLHGLPIGLHPQERFLYETLGAKEALTERIRTRISQGMGRATRNRQDFAGVLLSSRDLVSFISRDDVRMSMRPELQAELELGLQYADEDVSVLDALDGFFAQGEDWQPVETYLREESEGLEQQAMSGAEALAAAAPHEVRAWQHAWRGDFSGAASHARKAAGALAAGGGGPYRAFWLYLLACWADRAAELSNQSADQRAAAQARKDAEAAFATLRWFPPFGEAGEAPPAGPEYDWRVDRAAEWIEGRRRGPRIKRDLSRMLRLTGSDQAMEFEVGLLELGESLGFEAVRPNETSDPDGAWRDGDFAWLLWEAKTMEDADGVLAVRDVRQANSHATWVERKLAWQPPERLTTAIVCEKTDVHPDVQTVASGNLVLIDPGTIRELATRATEAIEIVTEESPGLNPEQLRGRIGQLFQEYKLGTHDILNEIGVRPLASS